MNQSTYITGINMMPTNQQWAPVNYYQHQQQVMQQQNNWAPAMPLNQYQQPQYFSMMSSPTIQPYTMPVAGQHFGNQPTVSNDWNPALSTNVTNLISSSNASTVSSVYSTNITGTNSSTFNNTNNQK